MDFCTRENFYERSMEKSVVYVNRNGRTFVFHTVYLRPTWLSLVFSRLVVWTSRPIYRWKRRFKGKSCFFGRPEIRHHGRVVYAHGPPSPRETHQGFYPWERNKNCFVPKRKYSVSYLHFVFLDSFVFQKFTFAWEINASFSNFLAYEIPSSENVFKFLGRKVQKWFLKIKA